MVSRDRRSTPRLEEDSGISQSGAKPEVISGSAQQVASEIRKLIQDSALQTEELGLVYDIHHKQQTANRYNTDTVRELNLSRDPVDRTSLIS